jgi:putative nucleotidyltransferase-like protein
MRSRASKPYRPILERELLFRAITSSETEAVAAYKAWRSTVDFEGAIDPETTALLPLLYEALLKRGLGDPLLGIFAGVSRRAWYENHTLLASVQQALDCLAREQIGCVLVGEVPLVLTHYKSLYSRRIGQIDIVVSARQAQLAARLLNAAGWATDSPLAAEEVTYNHVRRFTGPAGRVLDLHWHFIGSAPGAATDEFFWAARQPCVVHGAQAWHLSPTAMLLHSLLADTPMLATMPALWVVDELALLAGTAKELDWARIVAFAIEKRLASRFQRKLQLLVHFGASIPDPAAKTLRDASAGLPEVIDTVIRCSQMRKQKYIPIGRRGVFADYLRSDRRPGLSHGVSDLSHFVRHRWGLRGRREILSVVARGIWHSMARPMSKPTGCREVPRHPEEVESVR